MKNEEDFIFLKSFSIFETVDGREAKYISNILVNPEDFNEEEKIVLNKYLEGTKNKILLDKYTTFFQLSLEEKKIIRKVAKLYNTPAYTLFMKNRRRPGTEARQYAIRLFSKNHSQKEIQKIFKMHNHSLVLHAIRKINDLEHCAQLDFLLKQKRDDKKY